MTKTRSQLRLAYDSQKYAAKKRGIGWEFSFDSWLDVWDSSRHLHERGQLPHQFCMSRIGDVGPYADWNVEIKTNRENWTEAGETNPIKWALKLRASGLTSLPTTPRQTKVLKMIGEFIVENSIPPTCAEIAGSFGWASVNAAVDHVKALERKGMVKRIDGAARGIRITEEGKSVLEAA